MSRLGPAGPANEIVHMFPDQHGMLPCCGLHKLDALQSDRATVLVEHVTCQGARRYRGAGVISRLKAPFGRRA